MTTASSTVQLPSRDGSLCVLHQADNPVDICVIAELQYDLVEIRVRKTSSSVRRLLFSASNMLLFFLSGVLPLFHLTVPWHQSTV